MTSKAELLDQAKERGFDVNTKTTKEELESMLDENRQTDEKTLQAQRDNSGQLTQEGSANPNGEKTSGTTKDGDESEVTNETSVPQNGVTDVETLEVTDTPIGREADEKRTEEDVRFADESNPNQKRRDGGAPGEEFDQDGNVRTGGYSYGVSADDTQGTVFPEENKGNEPEEDEEVNGRLYSQPVPQGDFLNTNTNNEEWGVDKQRELEKSLSDPSAGIAARVTTSAGNYVRVKFFHNNKPLGTYRSRNFKESEARGFLDDLRDSQNV